MKNEDDHVFFKTVNEGCVQFVQIRRLVDEVVQFVSGRCVFDVSYDGVQNIDTQSSRCQFLIKSCVDDSL